MRNEKMENQVREGKQNAKGKTKKETKVNTPIILSQKAVRYSWIQRRISNRMSRIPSHRLPIGLMTH